MVDVRWPRKKVHVRRGSKGNLIDRIVVYRRKVCVVFQQSARKCSQSSNLIVQPASLIRLGILFQPTKNFLLFLGNKCCFGSCSESVRAVCEVVP